MRVNRTRFNGRAYENVDMIVGFREDGNRPNGSTDTRTFRSIFFGTGEGVFSSRKAKTANNVRSGLYGRRVTITLNGYTGRSAG